MAMIKISDLQMNEELDQQALSNIKGGSRSGAYTIPAVDNLDWSLINQAKQEGFKYLSSHQINSKRNK